MAEKAEPIAGLNGVVVTKSDGDGSGYRTYEVYQRERVGESTEKIKPIQLVSDAYRVDPYPTLEVLREHYPCYRDWLGNRYWLTRYDDVTSVFADEANFETRSKLWFYGLESFGRDLRHLLAVETAIARGLDDHVGNVAAGLISNMQVDGTADLARDFAARLPLTILAETLALPESERERFYALYWQAQRGAGWQPELQRKGEAALAGMAELFDPLVSARRGGDGEDLVSVIANAELDGGPASGADVAATLLEDDHETLHGSLANLWFLLLTHPDEFEKARSDRRLMKLAYLETLRHSAPVLSAKRFARHEVERFGRLLPEGALMMCSAAAANRDPRVFEDPDRFVVDRRDMCQREPRGQYRADGLASGIAFGLGKPSKHPAVPEDRPRSRYALVRDAAVAASMALVEQCPELKLADGVEPRLSALSVGEMHTCWQLPVNT